MNQGKWQKGQSGNPKGRPPKSRALSEILERVGSEGVSFGGKRVAGKRILATLLWQAAITGVVTFDGERNENLAVPDWIAIVKFLYGQIDGPPKQILEHTGKDGAPLVDAAALIAAFRQGVADAADE